MLQEILLGNFQGFAEAQNVQLKPLTLIFGPNSTGKSSIARAALLLQQSLTGISMLNTSLVVRGTSIDLASFSNVVHKHDLKKRITLGLKVPSVGVQYVTNSKTPKTTERINRVSRSLRDITYKLEASETGLSKVEINFHFVAPGSDSTPPKVDQVSDLSLVLTKKLTGEWQVKNIRGIQLLDSIFSELSGSKQSSPGDRLRKESDLEIKGPTNNEWKALLSQVRFRGLFPTLGPSPFSNPEDINQNALEVYELLFRALRFSLSRALDGVVHVKPLREIPERILIIDELDGERARRHQKDHSDETVLDSVSKWIATLTRGQYELRNVEFSPDKVGFMGKLRVRHLFDTSTKTQVSFKDVGVGLSQVLPIIETLVAAQISNKNSKLNTNATVIIEQPELHLHPRMQADLMDLISEIVLDPGSGMQIIAETHSENMILRLQKRIREGSVSADQVAIYYTDRDDSGANFIRELKLDSSGDFEDDWPLSFSDVRVQDLF